MILFLMVGWLVGLATSDVNMSLVVVLDLFGVPWGVPGGLLEVGVPRRSLGGPWASPGIPWEALAPPGTPKAPQGPPWKPRWAP